MSDPSPLVEPLPVLGAVGGAPGGASLRVDGHRLGPRVVLHSFRILLLVGILLVLRWQHQKQVRRQLAQERAPAISLAEIQQMEKAAASLSPWSASGMLEILDASGKPIGTLIHTRGESSEIIGYIGPTEVLLLLDGDQKIAAVRIYRSADTLEHVKALEQDRFFLNSWNGLSWEEAASRSEIDTVSGATLTSLAVIQSVRSRLGQSMPSFKFPDEVDWTEIQQVFPNAEVHGHGNGKEDALWHQVLDGDGNPVGYYLRSSPVADAVNGYQGPTDFLTFFDPQGRYLQTVIRSSYDNQEPEPFVDYVREEEYFLIDRFAGLTREQLVQLEEADVEGVSGATMTSSGLIRALQQVCQRSLEEKVSDSTEEISGLSFGSRDIGLLIVLAGGFLSAFTKIRHSRKFRFLFLVALVTYLGFLNGDILSQTVLVGWTRHGAPWHLAPGLVCLSLAALLVPILTGRNLYCQSVCPFGAAQQLVGKIKKKKWKMPAWLRRVCRRGPAILLVSILAVSMLGMEVNLAAWEPFDAFRFRIAGLATLSIAIGGLLFSIFVPMAYCRFGCPTGAVLEYLRMHGKSDRFGLRDALAAGMLAASVLFFLLN
ncbi:MAG: 4Fe-4S binding protein [Planctomycetota bacterium]|nr:4Fe-4S binding protein [Planctomycetota bacterium]